MRTSRVGLNSKHARCLVVAALLCCAGCSSFTKRYEAAAKWMRSDPSPEPRSVQELYYEALNMSASNPENNITPYNTGRTNWVVEPPQPGGQPPAAPPEEPLPIEQPIGWEPSHASRGGSPKIRQVSASSAHVTDIFQETDVRQAIQSLATQAGVKVVMDDAVGGFTSAIIEDEPFDAALAQVLMPLGLVSKYTDGQYLIATDDPESSMFALIAESADYRPAHRPPQELYELLSPRSQRYVRVVERSNLLVVEAPATSLEMILSQLQQFDRPVPQVVLEAIVCVLSPQEGVQHGFDFGHALSVGDNSLLGLGLSSLSFTGSFTPWGIRNWANDFAVTSLFVRMLADEGYLTIRAAPRVMAKDGEQAEISIGRETYFSTQPLASDLVFRTDIERVEAGINLNITPTIRGDNITVTIEKAEVSEDIRNEIFDRKTNPYPLINRRRVSTTVDVKDGETIVIGGLATRQTVDRVGRVPYLGDVPLVGKLFRIVESQEQDVEVVIFISPRLVHSDQDAAEVRRQAPVMTPAPMPVPMPAPGPPPEIGPTVEARPALLPIQAGPQFATPVSAPAAQRPEDLLPRIEPRTMRHDPAPKSDEQNGLLDEPTVRRDTSSMRLPPPRLISQE